MRITQRSMHAGVQTNLQGALQRLQKLQEQLSSGKAISKPSDSPTSTVSALRYRADIRRAEQYGRNADDAQGWLDAADRALTGQITIINRARELALQGVNGTMGPQAREALASEVDNLRQAAFAVANTSYLGRPIFGGTSTSPIAYDPATGDYVGDTGTVARTVAKGVDVQVNVTGPDAFGPPGDDLFTVLAGLAEHLRSGDLDELNADIDRIDGTFRRLSNQVSAIGARANQVMGMKDRNDAAVLDSTNGLAEVESIDLPATIVKLQMQEVAYQAALGATARMIQPSLVDFLR